MFSFGCWNTQAHFLKYWLRAFGFEGLGSRAWVGRLAC